MCAHWLALFPGPAQFSATLPYWKQRKAGRGLGTRLLTDNNSYMEDIDESLLFLPTQSFRTNTDYPACSFKHQSSSWKKLVNQYSHSNGDCIRIAENFQERKLLQIGEKYTFLWRKFHGSLSCVTPKDATSPNFAEKTFMNSHKTTKFAEVSPSKLSRYMVLFQWK